MVFLSSASTATLKNQPLSLLVFGPCHASIPPTPLLVRFCLQSSSSALSLLPLLSSPCSLQCFGMSNGMCVHHFCSSWDRGVFAGTGHKKKSWRSNHRTSALVLIKAYRADYGARGLCVCVCASSLSISR